MCDFTLTLSNKFPVLQKKYLPKHASDAGTTGRFVDRRRIHLNFLLNNEKFKFLTTGRRYASSADVLIIVVEPCVESPIRSGEVSSSLEGNRV